MLRKAMQQVIADQGVKNTQHTIIGYKTITIRYFDYLGNHPDGKDTGDDLMGVAQAAVYFNQGQITIGQRDGFGRWITVKLTYAEFNAVWAWRREL